jgi:hypothetical protein
MARRLEATYFGSSNCYAVCPGGGNARPAAKGSTLVGDLTGSIYRVRV